MRIEHFGGQEDVRDAGALNAVLEKRVGAGVNEFLLSRGPKYPLLAILVRGSSANLHFFPNDGHPGFVSRSRQMVEDSEPNITFFTNTPTEEIEVDARSVVSFDDAAGAAQEFFASGECPTNIEWLEL